MSISFLVIMFLCFNTYSEKLGVLNRASGVFISESDTPLNIGSTNGLHILFMGQSNAIGFPYEKKGLTELQVAGTDTKFLNQIDNSGGDYTGELLPVTLSNFAVWGQEIVSSDILQGTLSTNIYVTKVAYNGHSITQFQPGQPDYVAALAEVEVSKTTWGIGDPDVIVWMQGESDSDNLTEANNYYGLMNTMFDSGFLVEYPSAKIVNCGLSSAFKANTNFPYADIVDTAQQRFCNERTIATYLSGEGITSEEDEIHHDANGQITYGGRVAGAIIGLFNDEVSTNALSAKNVYGENLSFANAIGGSVVIESVTAQNVFVGGVEVVGGGGISPFDLEFYTPFESDSTVDWAKNKPCVDFNVVHSYDPIRKGGVITLDGSLTSHVDFTSGGGIALTSNCTIAVWMKHAFEYSTNWTEYVTGYDGAFHAAPGYLTWRNRPDDAYRLQIIQAYNGVQNAAWIADILVVDYTVWHHWALVFEGANVTSYLDGQFVKTTVNADSANNLEGVPIRYIGLGYLNGATPPAGGFNGSLDEYIILNRGLSAAEVLEFYNLQKVGGTGIKGVSKP